MAPEGLPLYGIPIAIKDNIDVAGISTTAACADFAYTPEADAAAVSRLRAAGALVIGKTNLDQFATRTGRCALAPMACPATPSILRWCPAAPVPARRSPCRQASFPSRLEPIPRVSGRVPAGLNNIVGLKPSLGAVSTIGVVPACRSLDCVSIFALTVEDAYFALRIIAGFDEADFFSPPDSGRAAGCPPGIPRIGSPDAATLTFGGDKLAEAAFSTALAGLANTGATFRAVNIQSLLDARRCSMTGHGSPSDTKPSARSS